MTKILKTVATAVLLFGASEKSILMTSATGVLLYGGESATYTESAYDMGTWSNPINGFDCGTFASPTNGVDFGSF